jgi:hypothetical protein
MVSDHFDPDAMFSRPSKESHISTILYEIRMLRFCLTWLTAHGASHKPAEEVYVALECFLLHYRNLANFLSGKGGSHGDLSMAAPRHWTDGEQFDEEKIAAIKAKAAVAYTSYSGDISTFLAHCTNQRYEQSKRWNPSQMFAALESAMVQFEKAFAPTNYTRGESFLGTPEDVVRIKKR